MTSGNSDIPANLITWYNELKDFIESSGLPFTYPNIQEHLWPNVKYGAVSMRVLRVRKAGFDLPPIVPKKKKGTPRHSEYSNYARYAQRSDIPSIHMGDPNMPQCPMCKKRDNKNKNGKYPHLEKWDGYVYCPACGYDPELLEGNTQ